jgi:DNA-directed RNA polymerase specialized sigma24 family protein
MRERTEVVVFWSEDMHGRLRKKVGCYRVPRWIEYEDMLQEAYAAVATLQARQGVDRATMKYLGVVVDNRIRNYIRRHWRLKTHRNFGDDECDGLQRPRRGSGEGPAAILDVREAVGSLPDRERAAVESKFVDGASDLDVAKATDEPYGTVLWRVKTAFSLLRARLADYRVRGRSRKGKKRDRRRMRETDWSKWGPIPNQRDDD